MDEIGFESIAECAAILHTCDTILAITQTEDYRAANLYRLKNRALIKELILWNPNINVDRIMALVQLILYREEKMILYQGNPSRDKDEIPSDYLGNDPFFQTNYDNRFKDMFKDKTLI